MQSLFAPAFLWVCLVARSTASTFPNATGTQQFMQSSSRLYSSAPSSFHLIGDGSPTNPYRASSDRFLPEATVTKSDSNVGTSLATSSRDELSTPPATTSTLSSEEGIITGAPYTWVPEHLTTRPTQDGPPTIFTNVSTTSAALLNALSCYIRYSSWRHKSATYFNETIFGHTWIRTEYSTPAIITSTEISTIYPSSVSTYKLCDGTPRANVRPITTTITSTSPVYNVSTVANTPPFLPEPCTLTNEQCRLLWTETDADIKDDQLLQHLCGNANYVTPQCILHGGPVELVYFPVRGRNDSICSSGAGTGTFDNATMPLYPGVSDITTLGHTFKTGAVYLSFKTLYATYDGFMDTVGPTFTNLIVTLQSTEVSTQCAGGTRGAFGDGTRLNYADLNWPVPASAYSCQSRCDRDYTGSPSVDSLSSTTYIYDYAPPSETECSTIWSDVNPILAIPTKILDLAPEWSTCSFWNSNIGNRLFDPPIALTPAAAVATPTMPVTPPSVSATPSKTPESPLAPTTADPLPTAPASTSGSGNGPASMLPGPSTPAESSTSDPGQPARPEPSNTESFDASSAPIINSGSSSEAQSPTAAPSSILLNIVSPADSPSANSPQPKQTASGVIINLSGSKETIVRNSDHLVLDSATLTAGQVTTISDAVISVNPTAFVVDSTPVPVSKIPSQDADIGSSILEAGGLRVTASSNSEQPNVIAVDDQTLSVNGPAATISGHTITQASNGIYLVGSSHPAKLTPIDTSTERNILAAGRITVTVEASTTLGHALETITVDGHVLSKGGPGYPTDNGKWTVRFDPTHKLILEQPNIWMGFHEAGIETEVPSFLQTTRTRAGTGHLPSIVTASGNRTKTKTSTHVTSEIIQTLPMPSASTSSSTTSAAVESRRMLDWWLLGVMLLLGTQLCM